MTKQTEIDFARAARDRGIKKAADSADRAHKEWSEQAYIALGYFLKCYSLPFMTENFRQWCHDMKMIPEPPSARAFGSVIVRAVKNGLIKRVGYEPVKNIKAHRTPATVWRKI